MVFHQHVGIGYHTVKQLSATYTRRVQGNAFLVGIQVKESQAFLRVWIITGKRPHPARCISETRCLNFDDLCPIIGEYLGAPRGRYTGTKIQYTITAEQSGWHQSSISQINGRL
jgi:hypothetical protein